MIRQIELLMLFGGAAVLVFLYLNRSTLKQLSGSSYLSAAYACFFIGWCATVAEGFFLEQFFNFIEHLLYALGCVLTALWCRERYLTGNEND